MQIDLYTSYLYIYICICIYLSALHPRYLSTPLHPLQLPSPAPGTATGLVCLDQSAVLPRLLKPQHLTPPPDVMTHVCMYPRAMRVAEMPAATGVLLGGSGASGDRIRAPKSTTASERWVCAHYNVEGHTTQ